MSKKSDRNFVAKYMNDFNRSQVEIDRKKRRDRGYRKHKNAYE